MPLKNAHRIQSKIESKKYQIVIMAALLLYGLLAAVGAFFVYWFVFRTDGSEDVEEEVEEK